MGTLNIPCASRRQRHRGEGKGPVFHVEHWLSFFLVRWWDCAPVARIKSFLHWGKVLFCVPKENQKWFSRLCAGQVLFFRSNSFALRAGQSALSLRLIVLF